MRSWTSLIAIMCLSGCAGTGRPPLPPELVVVDPYSDEFQKTKADEQIAALRKTSAGTSVSRVFYVGWEMHYGYFLIPANAPDDLVMPDFIDQDVRAQFDNFVQPGRIYPPGEEPSFAGKRIVCECVGVEWSFYSQRRFVVRAARLLASDKL